MTKQLYRADNSIMQTFAAGSVDLIYMDPPFNSRAKHRIKPSRSPAEPALAFNDTWQWNEQAQSSWEQLQNHHSAALRYTLSYLRTVLGPSPDLAYLCTLAEQISWTHRLLRATGSIYLHCASNYSHYLRLVMEGVFGRGNFRNQIIWSYRTGGVSKRHFARKYDVILFFSKSQDYHFRLPRYRSYQKKRYGYNPRYPEHYDEEAKSYYHLSVCRDVWEDIPAIGTSNRERTGFPTQKPEALLERILEASSKPGQLVMDPFSGSGTTLVVAERLDRCWQGIDRSNAAIATTQRRLQEAGITNYDKVETGRNP